MDVQHLPIPTGVPSAHPVRRPLVFFASLWLLAVAFSMSRVEAVQGSLASALRSFLAGCLMAVPAALNNLDLSGQSGDAWVNAWWKPLVAFSPGIAEEVWARLFLTTLLFALLLPRSPEKPWRAVRWAVLIAALTHSAVHMHPFMLLSPNGLLFLIFTGLLYGVPMGLLFVKRDWERAAGFHFFIDLVRFMAAFLMA